MNTTLQQGLQAHQQGNYPLAQQIYESILARQPNDVNALQLLGTLLSAKGEHKKAIGLLGKSLALAPNQPSAFNNIASSFKHLGEVEKARQSYLNALKLKPDYLDAAVSLLSLLRDQKLFDEALNTLGALDNSLRRHLRICEIEARILRELTRFDAALSVYKELFSRLQPKNNDLLHDYALTLRLAGKADEAIPIFSRLLTDEKENYAIWHNQGNAYSDIGELDNALLCFQKVIALNPGYAPAHINLNDIYWELGDKDTFLKSYQETLTNGTEQPNLVFAYVKALLRMSDFQKAAKVLDAYPWLPSSSAHYLNLKSRVLYGIGETESALRYQKKSLEAADCDNSIRLDCAESLIKVGDYELADRVCSQVLQHNPYDRFGLALSDICRRKLNEGGDALDNAVPASHDYNHLIKTFDIRVGEDAAASNAYFSALSDYLMQLHTTKVNPLEQSLQKGTQTKGHLFTDNHPLIQTLVGKIRSALQQYMQSLGTFENHPLKDIDSQRYEFIGSWSVCLNDQGYHTNHVHPMGTFSSVIYISLPDVVSDSDLKQGWLNFGEPKHSLNTQLPAQRVIQPSVGKLVLFPSYFWHGTVPFHSNQSRMTIAFDVKLK